MTEEGTSSSVSQTIAADHDGHDGHGDGSELGHNVATTARPGAPADQAARDKVNVRMPADGAYLSVLRTATAGLAARLDFTLDEIEDMRIAVDEACAMPLSQAIPGSYLSGACSWGGCRWRGVCRSAAWRRGCRPATRSPGTCSRRWRAAWTLR